MRHTSTCSRTMTSHGIYMYHYSYNGTYYAHSEGNNDGFNYRVDNKYGLFSCNAFTYTHKLRKLKMDKLSNNTKGV